MKFLPDSSWNLVPKSIQNELYSIQKTIQKVGGECYLVGGAVRDLVMNQVPKEYDFTTSLPPQKLKTLFKKVIETGIKHGTVTLLFPNGKYEVTTFRKEIGYSDGRRPDKVEYGTNLEEDLMRRDFTMNALALNLNNLEIIDKHQGLEDINKKLIRAIGDPIVRFNEDGLRSIRGIRFHAVLGFEIEHKTYEAIWKTREITKKISVERFQDELYKILQAKTPSLGLVELVKNKIFSLFLPFEESENYEILYEVDKLSMWIPLRLAILFLYLTSKELAKVEEIFRALRLPKEDTKIAKFWMSFLLEYKSKNISRQEIIKDLSQIKMFSGKENFSKFFEAYLEILNLKEEPSHFLKLKDLAYKLIAENPPLTIADLAINGNDISCIYPNILKTKYGIILQDCLNEVLKDSNKNKKDYLLDFIKKYT
jgi:tRNA nucleotidyltransferase/poly(A) polymerase